MINALRLNNFNDVELEIFLEDNLQEFIDAFRVIIGTARLIISREISKLPLLKLHRCWV